MGLTLSGRYISLFLAVQIAYLLQAELDEKKNLETICTYWDDFHSCATTALADCQEGATELWEKLKKESRSLQFRGSLFELCAGGNGAPRAGPPLSLSLLLPALCALLTSLCAL
ncbi:hypothetical protein AOLI_G00053300 [Acnodon oligacanthus]